MSEFVDAIESMAERFTIENEFAEIEALMRGPNTARGSRRSGGGRRKARSKRPNAASKPRHIDEIEKPDVPVVRFHCGGVTIEAKNYYARNPGLLKVHARQTAAALAAGLLPSGIAAPRGKACSVEIYGLNWDEAALLRSRPRSLGDFLNFHAAQILANVASESET